jgi:hypothetical protein
VTLFAAALTLAGSTLAYPAVASATDRHCATVGRQESVERA